MKGKNLLLTLLVLLMGLVVSGGTYAYLTMTADVTNEVQNVASRCFLVDYNVDNGDGTQNITGTLFPSVSSATGLSGRVGLKINSACDISGRGSLILHVNGGDATDAHLMEIAVSHCEDKRTGSILSEYSTKSTCNAANQRWREYPTSYCENATTLEMLRDYTTSSTCTSNGGVWVSSSSDKTPLKYAIYDNDNVTGTPIAVGKIKSSNINNDVVIHDDFFVGGKEKLFYIFIWLDGYLTDNTHAALSFDGYIVGSAVQSEVLLPSEYQQIEYVQTGGSQYINTGVLTKQSLKLSCDFSTTVASRTLFGGRASTSANAITFGFFSATPASFVGFGGATTNYSTSIKLLDGSKHKVILSNNTYQIDGVNQTINNRGTLSKYYNIYLGTWNNNGTADSRMFNGKIYRFSIWDDDEMISDFIPAKLDTTVGFYNRMTDTFHTNDSGTGSFVAGPDV